MQKPVVTKNEQAMCDAYIASTISFNGLVTVLAKSNVVSREEFTRYLRTQIELDDLEGAAPDLMPHLKWRLAVLEREPIDEQFRSDLGPAHEALLARMRSEKPK